MLVLCGSCVLRVVVSTYPALDISWDYGTPYGCFHAQLIHFTSLGVWTTLPVLCLYLSLLVQSLSRNLKLVLSRERTLLAFGVMAYETWMLLFIYCKWVTSFAGVVQLMYFTPSVTLLFHSLCQMRVVFARWKCPRDPEFHLFWPALLSMLYNIVMVIHLITIVTVQGSYDLFVAVLCGSELLYRIAAIVTFLYLLRTHWRFKKQEHSSQEPSRQSVEDKVTKADLCYSDLCHLHSSVMAESYLTESVICSESPSQGHHQQSDTIIMTNSVWIYGQGLLITGHTK